MEELLDRREDDRGALPERIVSCEWHGEKCGLRPEGCNRLPGEGDREEILFTMKGFEPLCQKQAVLVIMPDVKH